MPEEKVWNENKVLQQSNTKGHKEKKRIEKVIQKEL
jgi:hypothetical protein